MSNQVSQASPPATPDTALTPEVLAVLDALATRILADLAAMLADLDAIAATVARIAATLARWPDPPADAPATAPAPRTRRCAGRHARREVTR